MLALLTPPPLLPGFYRGPTTPHRTTPHTRRTPRSPCWHRSMSCRPARSLPARLASQPPAPHAGHGMCPTWHGHHAAPHPSPFQPTRSNVGMCARRGVRWRRWRWAACSPPSCKPSSRRQGRPRAPACHYVSDWTQQLHLLGFVSVVGSACVAALQRPSSKHVPWPAGWVWACNGP